MTRAPYGVPASHAGDKINGNVGAKAKPKPSLFPTKIVFYTIEKKGEGLGTPSSAIFNRLATHFTTFGQCSKQSSKKLINGV